MKQLAEVTGSWKVRTALIIACMVLGYVLACSTDQARADHQACPYKPATFPVKIRNEVTGAAGAAVWEGIEAWNGFRPGTFMPTTGPATIIVKPGSRTWVDMPCGKSTSTFYVGSDVNIAYWAPHELGHTLGFADHIKHTTSSVGYINPRFCSGTNASPYVGIMSYCAPRSSWFGDQDRWMYIRAFGYRVVVPQ